MAVKSAGMVLTDAHGGAGRRGFAALPNPKRKGHIHIQELWWSWRKIWATKSCRFPRFHFGFSLNGQPELPSRKCTSHMNLIGSVAYVASPLLEMSQSVRQAATALFVRLASYHTCHDMYATIFGRGRLHLIHFGGRDPCCLRAMRTRLTIEDIASIRLVCQGVGLSETIIDRQPLSVFRSLK